jgi:hypothetical protein
VHVCMDLHVNGAWPVCGSPQVVLTTDIFKSNAGADQTNPRLYRLMVLVVGRGGRESPAHCAIGSGCHRRGRVDLMHVCLRGAVPHLAGMYRPCFLVQGSNSLLCVVWVLCCCSRVLEAKLDEHQARRSFLLGHHGTGDSVIAQGAGSSSSSSNSSSGSSASSSSSSSGSKK